MGLGTLSQPFPMDSDDSDVEVKLAQKLFQAGAPQQKLGGQFWQRGSKNLK